VNCREVITFLPRNEIGVRLGYLSPNGKHTQQTQLESVVIANLIGVAIHFAPNGEEIKQG
jgi:hypothetical protein